MKKSTLITWVSLISLTILSAIISTYFFKVSYLVELILLIAAIKFIIVAYFFMDLKKAHIFWKTATLLFLLIFLMLIIVVF
jgi:hypothetical protein